MKRAVCPFDPTHDRFYTTAVMVEEWIVDGEGNWHETVEGAGAVLSRPDSSNSWTCVECGREAKFIDDEKIAEKLEQKACEPPGGGGD